MYLIVKISDDTIGDMLDAVDACRFVDNFESAKRYAHNLKAADAYDYEIIDLQTKWTTGQKDDSEYHI